MAKYVYVFDSTNRLHEYVSTVQVDDNASLESNQTTVAVGNGRFFNGREWVNETINVYHYNSDGYFDYYSVAPQGTALETNETLVAPLNSDGSGMYKPKWDATQGKWIETLTQEEIDALNKPAKPEPTAEQQMISLLGQQVVQDNTDNVQLKQDNVQLKQMVSVLGQTVAQLKAQSTTTTN